jgi:hypothetical protein
MWFNVQPHHAKHLPNHSLWALCSSSLFKMREIHLPKLPILCDSFTTNHFQTLHYISPIDYSSKRMDVIVSAPMQIIHIFVFLTGIFCVSITYFCVSSNKPPTLHPMFSSVYHYHSSYYVTWFAWSEMADWETVHVCWFWWMVTDAKGLHTDEEWTVDRYVPSSINVDLELVWSCIHRIKEVDVMILVFEVGAVAAKDIIAADKVICQFLVFK